MVEQLRGAAAGRTPLPEPRAQAHQYLTKLSEHDDIEAYLHTFEVIASREAWEKEQWARILAPFLTGEAQQAYFSLQPPQNDDYDILSGEILARMGLSPVCAVQQFHQWMYDELSPVRAQAARLTRLAPLWLLPGGPTATQVVEKVVMDRLLRALPRHFQRAVSMKKACGGRGAC